ncbi:putative sequence-specific DNA binding protein [Zalerion maritima]|uniref:Sequence-specific DNA binding protein n=1 Tax=Zalerion maritima TaxID=339359 RepID=A0AAD5RXJ4_9PEZI|nr:putative sequence-specific DNA binding protein [Zalerion maritima]
MAAAMTSSSAGSIALEGQSGSVPVSRAATTPAAATMAPAADCTILTANPEGPEPKQEEPPMPKADATKSSTVQVTKSSGEKGGETPHSHQASPTSNSILNPPDAKTETTGPLETSSPTGRKPLPNETNSTPATTSSGIASDKDEKTSNTKEAEKAADPQEVAPKDEKEAGSGKSSIPSNVFFHLFVYLSLMFLAPSPGNMIFSPDPRYGDDQPPGYNMELDTFGLAMTMSPSHTVNPSSMSIREHGHAQTSPEISTNRPTFDHVTQQDQDSSVPPEVRRGVKKIETSAYLRFPDGTFYFTPDAAKVVIGRDQKAFRRRKALEDRRNIWRRQEALYTQGQGSYPGPFPEFKHFYKNTRSAISEEGGFMGGSDDEPEDNDGEEENDDTGPNPNVDPNIPPLESEPEGDDDERPDPMQASSLAQTKIKSSGTSERHGCPILRIHPPDADFKRMNAISREHLMIEYLPKEDQWQALGLGKNGFFINNEFWGSDQGPIILRSGCLLQVYSVQFTFGLIGIENGFTCLAEQNAAREQEQGISFEFGAHGPPAEDEQHDPTIAALELLPEAAKYRVAQPDAQPVVSQPAPPMALPVAAPSTSQIQDPHSHGLAAVAAAISGGAAYSNNIMMDAQDGSAMPRQPQYGHVERELTSEEKDSLGVLEADFLPVPLTAHDIPPSLYYVLPYADTKKGPGRPPKPGKQFSKRVEKELKGHAERKLQNSQPQQYGNTDMVMTADGLQQASRQPRARAGPKPPVVGDTVMIDSDGVDATPKRSYNKRKASESGLDESTDRSQKRRQQPRSKTPPLELGARDAFTTEQLMKPTRTYAWILYDILKEEQASLALKSIYKRIKMRYPHFFFEESTKGWESSVRHNLGGNDAFVKDEDGCWYLRPGWDPDTSKKLKAEAEQRAKEQAEQHQQHQQHPQQPSSQPQPYQAPMVAAAAPAPVSLPSGLAALANTDATGPQLLHTHTTAAPVPAAVPAPAQPAAPVLKPEVVVPKLYVSPYASSMQQQQPQQQVQQKAQQPAQQQTHTQPQPQPSIPMPQPLPQATIQANGGTPYSTAPAPGSSQSVFSPPEFTPQAMAQSPQVPQTVTQHRQGSIPATPTQNLSLSPQVAAGSVTVNGAPAPTSQAGPSTPSEPAAKPQRYMIYPGMILKLKTTVDKVLPRMRSMNAQSDAIMMAAALHSLKFLKECPLSGEREVTAFGTASTIIERWMESFRKDRNLADVDLVNPQAVEELGRITDLALTSLRSKYSEEAKLVIVSSLSRAIGLTSDRLEGVPSTLTSLEPVLTQQYEKALAKLHDR